MSSTLLLAIIITLASFNAQAQKKKFLKREVALISYNITIGETYIQKFAPYEGDFSPNKNTELSPLKSQLYITSWEMIKQALESQTGMYILPIDAYGNKFSYNNYGFPNTAASKAIKKGESKYYLKFDISIKPEDSQVHSILTAKPDSLALGPNQIQPILKIDVVIFPNNGIIPVCKTSVETKSATALEVNSALFDGLANDKYTQEPICLYGLLETTVAKLVGSIFANLK